MIIPYNECSTTETLYTEIFEIELPNYDLQKNLLITSSVQIVLTAMRYQ
jgi:hypothetical protein